MLMEPGAGGAIHDIVFCHNLTAALIKVNSPSSVAEASHIVNQIVSDDRPRLNSQGIDGTHVTEHFSSDVMQMVVLDPVVVRLIGIISPVPSGGNSAVVQIMDMI